MSYEWLYKLSIEKKIQDNPIWYKLKWKPVWFGTYYAYIDKHPYSNSVYNAESYISYF